MEAKPKNIMQPDEIERGRDSLHTVEIMSKRDDLYQFISEWLDYRFAHRPYDFDLCSYSPLRSFRTVQRNLAHFYSCFFDNRSEAQHKKDGNLPIHIACSVRTSLDVVKTLYNAYPDGAHQKNHDSKTPLDLAVENGASPEVVAFLQSKGMPSSKEESSSDDVKAVDKHETAECREESDQFTCDKTTRCEKADICRAISNR